MHYRIRWESHKTDAKGKGEPVFTTRQEAERVADDANKKWPKDRIWHWVEELPEPPETED
jgi:hypothetical protein